MITEVSMRKAFAVFLLALGASSPVLAQQRPVIVKVEPPNWWVGHSINPVRLLVRGANLRGATLACGRLACGQPTSSAARAVQRRASFYQGFSASGPLAFRLHPVAQSICCGAQE